MSKKNDTRRKGTPDPDGQPAVRWSADRVRKSEQTRRRLLEVLEDLLHEQPLDQVSVNDVAAAAGMRRTGFYFYFSSKEVAVATLLDELYDETFAGAADFLTHSRDRRKALRDAFDHMWKLWCQHRALMLAVLDARDKDREAAGIWESWLGRFVAPVAAFIEGDRASGLAPEGPPADMLLTLLLAMNVDCLQRMLRAETSADDADAQIDALTTVWIRSIYGHADPAGDIDA